MWRHFGHLFAETALGMLIGAIPVATHGVTALFVKDGASHASGWTADVLFLVITIAANNTTQTFLKLNGPLKQLQVGHIPVLMLGCSILVLVLAATLYGAYVAGQTEPIPSLNGALWMLVGAFAAAAATDLVVAQRLAEAT